MTKMFQKNVTTVLNRVKSIFVYRENLGEMGVELIVQKRVSLDTIESVIAMT